MRNPPIFPALASALLVSIGACGSDEVTDPEGPFGFDLEPRVTYDEVEELTTEQIAEVRRRVVASLPVDDLGRIDIVDAGVGGNPWFVYASVGGKAVHEVLDQLNEQDATPAEVFLALAPPRLVLPDVLVRDHEEKVTRGDARPEGPRRLAYKVPAGPVNHGRDRPRIEHARADCTDNGVEPISFASWIDDFETWSSGYVDWATHQEELFTTEGATGLLVEAGTHRAMSVCEASATSDLTNVRFGGFIPDHPEYGGAVVQFYIVDDLGDFESARMRSSGGPYVSYHMNFEQYGPPPQRAYAAAGRCRDSCL